MATTKPTLSYGSKGEDVKKLQQFLNTQGYNLSVDGDFGNNTQNAVKDFQQKNKLTADGIVGVNTWGAINNLPSSNTTNSGFQYDDFSYGDYTESDTVKGAEANLSTHLTSKPGEYNSQWQTQLDDYLNKIQNREEFSYDVNGDALYQQYKDKYIQQGKMAMQDAIGQASAMTGGYGNSYAASVGNQAYQASLQNLNDVIPELYALARDQYNQEGQDLYKQYGMLMDRENTDYGKYRDTMSDWNAERDYLQNRYDAERDYDYSKYSDDRNFSYGQYSDDKNYAYNDYRNEIADKQWQAEFDEAKRQYDEQMALKQQQYADEQALINNNTKLKEKDSPTGFTGKTYQEACAYVKSKGGSSASIMTSTEWQRHKNGGSKAAEVANYKTYQDYLADITEYLLQ